MPTASALYLDLLKRTLTRIGFEDEALNRSTDVEALTAVPLDPQLRSQGRDWPLHAQTMRSVFATSRAAPAGR